MSARNMVIRIFLVNNVVIIKALKIVTLHTR